MKVPDSMFFKIALNKAMKLTGKPGRIITLLAQLSVKLNELIKNDSVNLPILREQFLLIGRFIKAHINGKYRIKSIKTLIILLAAIIYFINPLDMIPDFIVGIGLTDDFAVLMWVFKTAITELDEFRAWEKSLQTNLPIIIN
jgi:uncharacterized membrane protein YkvA (DUF1232 family)